MPWVLAALALGLLVVVTRAHTLAGQEFAALQAACVGLPLRPRALLRARQAACLLPLLPGLGAAVLGLPAAGVRLPVLAAYLLACTGSAVVEVLSDPADPAADPATDPATDPVTKASRWLVSLVLCICLASEVMA